MDPNQSTNLFPQEDPRADMIRREMYRRSEDTIMVNNPTDEDFTVDWDGYRHIIPNRNRDLGWGKGKKAVKRYLAVKYTNDMIVNMINKDNDRKAAEIIVTRADKGQPELTPFEKQAAIYDRLPRTDNDELRKQYKAILFLGIYEEFGKDEPLSVPAKPMDKYLEPYDKELWEGNQRYQAEPTTPIPVTNDADSIDKRKEKMIREVAA